MFLCVNMLFSALAPLVYCIGTGEDDIKIASGENVAAQSSSTEKSIFPESKLEWKSYRDYLLDQARNAWNHPELYIGYEVGFIPYWESILCISGFEDDSTDVFVYLDWDRLDSAQSIDPYDTKLVIEDYYYEEESEYLWYKVKAAEGYTLPSVLEENPYVMHLECLTLAESGIDYVPPTFYIGPSKAVFLPGKDTVTFKKDAVAATKEDSVSVSDLPSVFDVTPVYDIVDGEIVWEHYDLGDIASEYTEYSYVSVSDVMMIPVEASVAFDALMDAEDTYEYYDVLSRIPTSVLEQLSSAHLPLLDDCIESLAALEHVKYETTVAFDGKQLPVSVVGKLPDNVTLVANVVSNDTVISEGFDIDDPSDVITALDIKLIDTENGTEWQPKEGRRVAVSIGVGVLGYEDGAVLSMHHKHGEDISKFDIFVVEDGAVTISTNGFSIYVVSAVGNNTTNNATEITAGSTLTLEVGQEVIYYVGPRRNNDYVNPSVSAWAITDTQGALHYNVYANGNPGSDGVAVRWLKLDALKEATDIELVFNYCVGNTAYKETYTLNVVAPKAEAGKKKLYLKDDVNKTGRIVATLVDENGQEDAHGLDGAAFKWERDDNTLILPQSYGDEYRSVNIARDHSGLVESRKDDDGVFKPTTYTLTAILSDGTEHVAEYTVYYQSEIINADFELPNATTSNYTFFPNGWPELYWATTAPGKGSNISKDIEYADITDGETNPGGRGTDFGVSSAAGGVQFAELNAEDFGALYQDIITAPGEDIKWRFSHAPRCNQNWGREIVVGNAMYIIIGATDTAQTLDGDNLIELGRLARVEANKLDDAGKEAFEKCESHVVVTFNGAEYFVWYHDAGGDYPTNSTDLPWTEIAGSYTVPEGQYRTRIFFASRPYNDNKDSDSLNAGNLIDNTKAGQYKKYLIEYYEQTYGEDGPVIERIDAYQEEGEALIFSSIKLENYYTHFIQEQHDYLHHVAINGEENPYDIRYSVSDPNNAYLYIQNYPGVATDPLNTGRNYSEYDIVMQVYLRDTVVAVQKQLVFPKELTEEQKLSLMDYFSTLSPAGYTTDFLLYSPDADYDYSETKSAVITQRDPSGNYQSFVALGNNPELGHQYIVEETNITSIPGLELSEVVFKVQLYKSGKEYGKVLPSTYTEIHIKAGEPLESLPFTLEDDVKIADVTVVNTYKEKNTVISYKAVGNGKVKFIEGTEFLDEPTEVLPFYSGKAKGAEVHAGNDSTFVGWFKDEACTIPVTAADGLWDKTTNTFKPNANVISSEKITFYAKFETGSVVINRENANPGQTFVYHVTNDATNADNVDMYITLECDENGNGTVSILEVPLGYNYTVTESEDWSWRHLSETKEQKYNPSTDGKPTPLTFDFDNDPTDKQWLNGCSQEEKNVFE